MTEPTPAGVPTPAKPPENPTQTPPRAHPNDPLHGITLETIVETLVDRHGWKEMAHRIPIRCFMFDPTMTSSLKFLRKTPWARQKVEDWYVLENRRYQR